MRYQLHKYKGTIDKQMAKWFRFVIDFEIIDKGKGVM
jgi:hypothetical protein